MAVINVTIQLEITDEQFGNLLVSAFEGGSNYWIERIQVDPRPRDSKAINNYETMFADGRGVRIWAEDAEEEGGYWLDKEAAIKGFQLLATYYPKCLSNIQQEQDDAEDADVWLQLALFGEVVYG